MDLGNLVGQMLQQGMSGSTGTRIEHALGSRGLGGQSGIEDVLGSLMGGRGGSARSTGQSGGGLGGLLGGLGEMLGGSSGVGNMNRGQAGGLGALAGAILGGGGGAMKGAVGGGAMALLGTMAISALKNWQASQSSGQAAMPGTARAPGGFAISEAEARDVTSEQTAELCLKGMINAAKADGNISKNEMDRIVGKLEEGGITAEEREFVLNQMSAPLDLDGLVRAVPNRQIGAQVYVASLLAIKLDTPSEKAYLGSLARGLDLDSGTVGRLHRLVGA